VKVEKLAENIRPQKGSNVQVKMTGNITEIRYMSIQPSAKIQKLDKDRYVMLETGEIKEFNHTEKRIENKTNIKQSIKRLRDLINTNVTNAKNCLWITLTYAENMQDKDRLYNDFRKFNMKLKYYIKAKHLPKYEYIVCAEPQKRGAWHFHLLLIFDEAAPFIHNDILAKTWGHGFTKTTALKNVDNIGAYLSAYLADIELTETDMHNLKNIKNNDLKTITHNGESKAIIKGARLKLYPTGFRLYRTSRGIKQPIIENCTNYKAMKKVQNSTMTYEKTIQLIDDNNKIINTINYRHFNQLRNNGE